MAVPPLHGGHHVPEKVDVTDDGVDHVLDVFQAAGRLPLTLVGFSAEAVSAVGTLSP